MEDVNDVPQERYAIAQALAKKHGFVVEREDWDNGPDGDEDDEFHGWCAYRPRPDDPDMHVPGCGLYTDSLAAIEGYILGWSDCEKAARKPRTEQQAKGTS